MASNWWYKVSEHCSSSVCYGCLSDVCFKKRLQERNTELLKLIMELIMLCGKHGLSLRGHWESVNDSSQNTGNFQAVFWLLSQSSETLKKHLIWPAARNATYLSPKIKNYIITYEKLQNALINENKKVFSKLVTTLIVTALNRFFWVWELLIIKKTFKDNSWNSESALKLTMKE